jgi:diguanylate cyclase
MNGTMPEKGRSPALSLVVPVAAVLTAGAGLVAAISGSDLATEIIVPASLAALLGGIFILLRGLERWRREAEARATGAREERTRRILDRSHDAYVAMNAEGVVTAWNAAAETLFGWRRTEAMGKRVGDLIVPESQRELHRAGLRRYLETGQGPILQGRTEVLAVHRDGAEIPVELSVIAVEEPGGKPSFHGFIRDITERKLLENQQAELLEAAKESARIDALTTLPNRRGWDESLTRELVRAKREGTSFCVALVDLDHFKTFNDTHGHQAGDRLLRRAASAWRLALRQSDLVARYGGEEFAVLLPVCGLEEAMEVIERLRVATPEGQTVSAGVAEWNGYESEEALIDRADFALYNAKRSGRDRSTAAA